MPIKKKFTNILKFKTLNNMTDTLKNLGILTFIVFLLVISISSVPQKQDSKPNIIFILTDDQRWDALGYSGNEIIHTPEMDQLAKEGCYFTNSFVTTPICAASRASIMTGLYERTHNYTFGQPPVQKQFIDSSYFTLLKKAGYYNGFLGKFGVEFHNKFDTALFDVYKPEGRNFYWRLINQASDHIHLTDLMGQRAVDFIEKAPVDKPFCLTVSYNAPHAEDKSPEQYIWPKDLDTLYQDIQIPAPRLSEDKYFEQQPDFVKQGFNRTRWLWRYNTPEKYQQMVKGYYRMISAVDQTIGRIRNALEDKGQADNTVIILMGDNGYFMGERQFAGKWLMYENSLRVPLIIYDPRVQENNVVTDFGLNIDIAPTILEFAGVDIPISYQGISLVNYVNGNKTEKSRETFLCEHLWDSKHIPASEGIRSEEWKYFRYLDYPEHEELYNLLNDPNETRNLALEEQYNIKLNEMREDFESMIFNLMSGQE